MWSGCSPWFGKPVNHMGIAADKNAGQNSGICIWATPFSSFSRSRRRSPPPSRKPGREAGAVTLVAVSKTFEAADIQPVIEAGQRVFGENRVQEAQGKWPDLKQAFADIELHLIGPLQSNKAKEAVALFDVIETSTARRSPPNSPRRLPGKAARQSSTSRSTPARSRRRPASRRARRWPSSPAAAMSMASRSKA